MRLGILASSFDPFPHPGHLWAMDQAIDAEACDGILAALHVDPTAERPSKRKPVLSVAERLMLLNAIHNVKLTVTYRTEAELTALMAAYLPVVRIIGEDHRNDKNNGDDLGIPVFWAKRRPDWSGTEFTRRIAETYK